LKGKYLIALLTDFGVKDGFVGTMKGVIYSINPHALIVDISHDISPQNIQEASYVLKSSAKYFPEHTIFLVVVDPGVGSSRKALIIKTSKKIYICPDNGILSWLCTEEEYEAIEITNKKYLLPNISNTFHGRDIFAPVSSYLSLGIDPYLMGKKIDNIKTIPESSPFIYEKNKACGSIIYIDRFGNLITNFSEFFFTREGINCKNIILEFKGHIINKLSMSYSENPQGSLLAVMGSAGHIEIAVNHGNAKDICQCNTGDELFCMW
jgi:S-adenosyl-L-methionine hydrolase (adenosine-forming)